MENEFSANVDSLLSRTGYAILIIDSYALNMCYWVSIAWSGPFSIPIHPVLRP